MCGWLEGKEARDEMISDIKDILDEGIVKCLCDYVLEPRTVRTSRIGNEFWIYAACPKCKYNFNYEKILRQYRAIKGVTYN